MYGAVDCPSQEVAPVIEMLWFGRDVVAGFAAGFAEEGDRFDDDGFLDRFGHVVERQCSNAGGGHGFHFDASFGVDADGGFDPVAGEGRVGDQIHVDFLDWEGMAEGNQIAGLFGGHDSGDAGGGEDVAFRGITRFDRGEGGGQHFDQGDGGGFADGGGFGGDIDHVGGTLGGEMAEAGGFGTVLHIADRL
jgi:hypothetical protein